MLNMGAMTTQPRSCKRTMAMTPAESRALNWYGKRFGFRGLAPLRIIALQDIVAFYLDVKGAVK
jgi:hypothetical protein